MSNAEQARAEEIWKDFWANTRAVELTADLTVRAGQLASEHVLRGADAIHVASALAIGTDNTVFALWDLRLQIGADAVGLRTAPAQKLMNGPNQP